MCFLKYHSNARHYSIFIKLRQQFVTKNFMQYFSLFEQVGGKVNILQGHSYLIPASILSLNFEFGCSKFVEMSKIVLVNLFCKSHEFCGLSGHCSIGKPFCDKSGFACH